MRSREPALSEAEGDPVSPRRGKNREGNSLQEPRRRGEHSLARSLPSLRHPERPRFHQRAQGSPVTKTLRCGKSLLRLKHAH